MDKETLIYLLKEKLRPDLSGADKERIDVMLNGQDTAQVAALLVGIMEEMEKQGCDPLTPEVKRDMFEQIIASDKTHETLEKPVTATQFEVKRHYISRKWIWVAASLISALAVGFYFMTKAPSLDKPSLAASEETEDIQPGRQGAILSLSNGQKVLLDTVRNGMLTLQGGGIVKVMNGELVYEEAGEEIVFHTMSTPNGRHYHLTLPDGTGVWLNAASAIRYPTRFEGKERRVELKGEGYFEVAKNEQMPFRVSIDDRAEVEVLGTHFNVNAYQNEQLITTTLLEGSVRFRAGGNASPVVLKPGAQAQAGDAIKVVEDADVEEAVAWKNGLFSFGGADIQTVMRQLARWYDVEVVYEGKIPGGTFKGKISKDLTLSQLLNGLGSARIRYRIEREGKIIILPDGK